MILAWTGDELSRGQTCGRTDGLTDGRTQATTIPEGQYWPRVKSYPSIWLSSIVSISIWILIRWIAACAPSDAKHFFGGCILQIRIYQDDSQSNLAYRGSWISRNLAILIIIFHDTQDIWSIYTFVGAGVGVTKPIFIPLYSSFFCIAETHVGYFIIEYHDHIWQLLPPLSCDDTCQISMWFKESNSYFCKIKNFAYREISQRRFSNPHPCSVHRSLCIW